MRIILIYRQLGRVGDCILQLQEMWLAMTIAGLTVYVNPFVCLKFCGWLSYNVRNLWQYLPVF